MAKTVWSDEAVYVTKNVPGNTSVSLFTGLSRQVPLKDLKKEAPEAYHAVEAISKDHSFKAAKSVLIRENGSGLLPTVLAKVCSSKVFKISVWTADVLPAIQKNLEVNHLERVVSLSIDGLDVGYRANVAILVHENYQSCDTILYEISMLLQKCADVLFVVSHKNKGIETILEKLKATNEVQIDSVQQGMGGARVIKLSKLGTLSPNLNLGSFSQFVARGVKVAFDTGMSLFSSEHIDEGSRLLIKYVVGSTPKSSELTIYDMGCGYGALGISLAKALGAQVIMSDVNSRAVAVTERNIKNQGLEKRAKVLLSDGADGITGEYDLVVSNPPLHIPKSNLVRVIRSGRNKARKGGRFVIVVEDSRASEIRELLEPFFYLKVVKKTKNHVILENKK